MHTLATWGLVTMSGVGIMSLLMARYENEIFTIIGCLIMIGLTLGGFWYVATILNSTFF